MPVSYSTNHTKKLASIREKITVLQQEETKICHDISKDLSQRLIDAQAIEIDFDTLIGGMLDVIAQVKTNTTKSGIWKKSGQDFCRNRNQKESEKKRIRGVLHRENGQAPDIATPQR